MRVVNRPNHSHVVEVVVSSINTSDINGLKHKLCLPFKHRGAACLAMIDSGADGEFVSERMVHSLGLPLERLERPVLIKDAKGRELGRTEFKTTIALQLESGMSMPVSFFVAPIAAPFILGLNWMDHSHAILDVKAKHVSVKLGDRRVRVHCRRLQEMPFMKSVGSTTLKLLDLDEFEQLVESDNIEYMGVVHISEWGITLSALDAAAVTDTDIKEGCSIMEQIVSEFGQVFGEPAAGLPPKRNIDHRIELKEGTQPIARTPYRLNPEKLEELERQLKALEESGYIRKSNSPWGAPVLFVGKKDGSMRLCVDYRALNAKTVRDQYPLPLIDDLIAQTHHAKIFSKIDLRQAYHQVRIVDEDVSKTAFRTRYGSYEFTVVPFGLCNAPATFQRFIQNTLAGLLDKGVVAYLDDILIYSETAEEHEVLLRQVLTRLQENRLYAKPEKCEFFKKQIGFLGHMLSPTGVSTEPQKISAVREWGVPTSVTDVRAFLGLAGYYRRFVDKFAELSAPLTDLLKNDTDFVWDSQAQASFDQLKQALTSAPVLATFDPRADKRLESDASNYAIGGALHQKDADGDWHPICYFSRKMSDAERNYTVYEQELLALVECLKEWEHWLNRNVEILTDHKPLEYIFTQQDAGGRKARWIEVLSRYDAAVKYRKGVDNWAADALSRAPELRPVVEAAPPVVVAEPVAPEPIQPSVILAPADKPPVMETPVTELPVVEPAIQPALVVAADAEMDDLSAQFSELQMYAVDLAQQSPQAMRVVLLHPFAKLPASAHNDDTGYNVETPETVVLQPGVTTKVPLGLAVEAPEGTFVKIEGRSGLATRGIQPVGGVVDRGYTGEVAVLLHNTSGEPMTLEAGSRIAQLVVVKNAKPVVVHVAELRATPRGAQGVGSTGTTRSIAAISGWTVDVGTPLDSYKGDKTLERVFEMVSGETAVAVSAANFIRKFHVKDGVLYKNDRRCVGPVPLRAKLLSEAHEAANSLHAGEARTTEQLRSCWYWPGMHADVVEYVRCCDVCQKTKSRNRHTKGLLQPLDVPDRPWQSIAMDFVTRLPATPRKHTAVMTVIDRYTKMAHFVPTRDTATAKETAELFFQHIVRLHGLPDSIVSDRDPKFTSKFWSTLFKRCGTKLKMSTSSHPQTDGQSERANQQMEALMRATCKKATDWDLELDRVELAFNSTVNSSTGYSPFELNYGFVPRMPIHGASSESPAVDSYLESLGSKLDAARENIEQAQERAKRYYDQGRRELILVPGDEALIDVRFMPLKDMPSRTKRSLWDKRQGPFKVLSARGNNAYELDLPPHWECSRVINVEHLEKYHRSQRYEYELHHPPPDHVDGKPEWEVDAVVDVRKASGRREFLVKWVGYDDDDNTWEPEEFLNHAQAAIAEYAKQNRSKMDKMVVRQRGRLRKKS